MLTGSWVPAHSISQHCLLYIAISWEFWQRELRCQNWENRGSLCSNLPLFDAFFQILTTDVPLSKFRDAHFAVFPEKLIEPCVLAGCPKNGLVLDPFFGAGTTGVVASKLRRNYLGLELNPEYVEIAKNRLSNIQIDLLNSSEDRSELLQLCL